MDFLFSYDAPTSPLQKITRRPAPLHKTLIFGSSNKKTRGKRTFTNRSMTKKRGHIKRDMKCNPIPDAFRISKSCYTPQILENIKHEYNKDHSPKDQIHTSNPTEIWKELSERLVHCEKEDCWLNQIKDENLRKKIDRYIFAPDKPYEWKSDPNTWLSNYDILNVLEQYEVNYPHFEFMGPTPIDFDARLETDGVNPYDTGRNTQSKTGSSRKKCVWNELCNFSLKQQLSNKKNKIGIIFNLDKHYQNGSHWVSLFIDISRRFMFYFDSAGGNMPEEVNVFIERIQKQAKELDFQFAVKTNGSHAHQQGNTECGVYSLFFIIMMLTGRSTPKSRKMPLKKVMDLFLKERVPDKTVAQYRNEYFND
jgi:hypothetical protein